MIDWLDNPALRMDHLGSKKPKHLDGITIKATGCNRVGCNRHLMKYAQLNVHD